MFDINTPKDNEGMKSELIQELNKHSPSKDKSEPKEQLVKYKKGETVKTLDGYTVTRQLPLTGGARAPMKTVEGEPENADEFKNELASEIWNSGKSIESAYNDMRKKYKGASALINIDNATFNDPNIPEKDKKYKYYEHRVLEGPDGEKEDYYISPKDAAEIALAETYGLNIEYKDRPLAQLYNGGSRPSIAAKIINSDKELKKNWETYLNHPEDLAAKNNIRKAIQKLKDKSSKEIKGMGFNSKPEYDQYVKYIEKSFTDLLLKQYAGEDESDEAKETKPAESTIEKIKAENKKAEEPETETKNKKAEEPEIKEEEPETETKKDETGDPLEKIEELEQKKYQSPADCYSSLFEW